MLMSIQITHAAAVSRVHEVLTAIVNSAEWARLAASFGSMDWIGGRQEFLQFFDVFEGRDGSDWLGIMEWAVNEEMRLHGTALNRDIPTAVSAVVARMAGHPDVRLLK